MSGNDFPLVSIIIPHLQGREILVCCLESIRTMQYKAREILLVDNGSTDGSVESVAGTYPEVTILRSDVNLGYAGGCNLGLARAKGEFGLLLNDDAVVAPGMLSLLVEAALHDDSIAACQPKILSLRADGDFDYAGAAGGELDRYGFPFCRGRMFDSVEADNGQYDAPADIFWASGACCLLRMEPLKLTGFLDESFFAHMEEIDLQWRLKNRGYRVVSVPKAVARHEAGSTLSADRPYKLYLNYRNSLIMLLKNHPGSELLTVLPVRICLDLAAAVYRCVKLQPMNALAILHSYMNVLTRLVGILKKRSGPLKGGMDVGLFPRSIVWEYFVRRKKRFSDINWRSPAGHV